MNPTRRPNYVLLGSLIAILLFFIFFIPSYGWRLREVIAPSNISPDVFMRNGAGASTTAQLLAENEALRAKLNAFQNIASQIPTSTPGYLRAVVYSRYPFDFKNELFVNAGTSNGVATGDAVVYQGVFVGQVSSVWASHAAVRTVFDNNFRLPVRIGSTGVNGLLTGGSYPFIASIAKHAVITRGDVVYTAGVGTPYALPVGEVAGTSTSPDHLFTQATVSFPYDINQIRTVLIAKGS